eukprot:gene7469-5264_t
MHRIVSHMHSDYLGLFLLILAPEMKGFYSSEEEEKKTKYKNKMKTIIDAKINTVHLMNSRNNISNNNNKNELQPSSHAHMFYSFFSLSLNSVQGQIRLAFSTHIPMLCECSTTIPVQYFRSVVFSE